MGLSPECQEDVVVIILEGVSKSFDTPGGKHRVFDDLHLVFPTSSTTALLGRNGAGKSTLMAIIAGALEPDSGRVHRLSSLSWPVGLGSGFQGSLTGRQNTVFISRVHGDSAAQTRRRVEFVQEFAEVGHYFDMPMSSYSNGMRSRVAFGMSMAFDFEMYLVDEVTAVGDIAFRKKCISAFDQKRASNAGMILVSHDMSLVKKWCDRAIYIEDGKITIYQNINEAIQRYKNA